MTRKPWDAQTKAVSQTRKKGLRFERGCLLRSNRENVMPATYAHYKFGKLVFKALPKEIRALIRENKAAYLLGLHGPDLVFYYRPVWKNKVNQSGVQMHKEPAIDFFEKGRRKYQEHPSNLLLSYLCGFLCHFMLDSECHPYINGYGEKHHLGHLEIETDFDRFLIEEDGKDPVHLNCTAHLCQDHDTEEVIASMFEGLTYRQIDQSIQGFRRCIRFFQCPTKGKRMFLRGVSRIVGQDKEIGGLIMDGVPKDACRKSCLHLKERLHAAVLPAAEIIEEYVYGIATGEPLCQRLARDYEKSGDGVGTGVNNG
jgi:hypothetical protein